MNSSKLRILLFTISLLCSLALSAGATHLRAGEITVERLSCNSLTFRITITVYTNTFDTDARLGGTDDWLDFGDGSAPILVPLTQNTLRPDLGKNIGTASFSIERTFPGFGEYIIRYTEPNRNKSILNIDNSVNTPFHLETKIVVDPYFGCNNTPILRIPPIDRACTGVAWFHNPGATDVDGDSLSYSLVTPFMQKGRTVVNYRHPNSNEFYLNFEVGNEDGKGPPTFSIDARNGTITWDAPGMSGEYNIAFIVREWRKIEGTWYENGYVRRDMQIIVEDCNNERPDLITPEDVCVIAGTTLERTIFGTDPDNHDIRVEAISEIFDVAPSPATWAPSDGAFRKSTPPYELKFRWPTQCAHVKDQPYQVVFKVTDRPPNGPPLVTFKTWRITVIGPAPRWAIASVPVVKRVAALRWEKYSCENADSIDIWRRVDSNSFVPDSCQTGMPEQLGYERIARVSTKNSVSYIDNNQGRTLQPGARYCYRLVARFPAPRGGESIVSAELCSDPVTSDEPVITNVSIEKTDPDEGTVLIRWTRPLDLNAVEYPPPYRYEVLRDKGSIGSLRPMRAHAGFLTDTVFFDSGINTRDEEFSYRVILSARPANSADFVTIDTSQVASSVRLSAIRSQQSIALTWSAKVPWSNRIETTPNEHLVFRGSENSDEPQLSLIASVNPIQNKIEYTDAGQHNNTPLGDEEYCYRVMTRGSYGNPRIAMPLENYSQIICVGKMSNERPCKPQLLVQQTDCSLFNTPQSCDPIKFTNVLTWTRPLDSNCNANIAGYKIYRAASEDGDFIWLDLAGVAGIVRDTFFIDAGLNEVGLPSFAFCYRITAINTQGIESELSEVSCNDNCPYYELPNVFSPDDGNGCNDRFGAWRPSEYYIKNIDESGSISWRCGTVTNERCARFIQSVTLRVYNRWGKEVYWYRSGGERTIYIDWDGRDNEGTNLSSGVYFYIAEVSANALRMDRKNFIRKGWVQIVR